MEIREGIKFKDEYDRLCTITSVKFDYNVGHWIVDWKINNKSGFVRSYLEGILDSFEISRYTIIEYPYKIGDWVVITRYENGDPENTVIQIEGIRDADSINYNSVVKKGMFLRATFGAIRPAFKDEIPKSKQKIEKENYDYLIPILIRLDE